MKLLKINLLLCVLLFNSFIYAGLVGEWKFDGSAKDSKGISDAKMKGKVKWGENRLGQKGKALYFDGESTCFKITPSDKWNIKNQMTIEFWLKIDQTGLDNLKFIPLVMQPKRLCIRTNRSSIYARVGNKPKDRKTFVVTRAFLKSKTWHFFALTFKDGAITLYADGKILATRKSSDKTLSESNSDITVGTVWKKYLQGSIDDLRIYNTALTLAEIKKTYASEKVDVSKMKNSEVEARWNIFAPLTSKKITLDGKINDPAWKEAKQHGGFARDGKPAANKTFFKVLRTKDGLYFAIKAEGGKPVAKIKCDVNTGGSILKDDAIEIFFAPNFYQTESRKQFVFNALGSRAEFHGNGELNPWKVRCNINNDGYTAEAYFPYSTIGVKDTGIIGFNMARDAKNSNCKKENTTWAPLTGPWPKSCYEYGKIILSNGGGAPIVTPEITADENSIIIYNKEKSPLKGWIDYFCKTGTTAASYKFIKKSIVLKPGKNEFLLSSFPGITGGIEKAHLLTLVRLKNNDITAVKTVKFYTKKKIATRTLGYTYPKLTPTVKKADWKKEVFNFKDVKQVVYYPSPKGYEKETAQKIKKYLGKSGIKIAQIKEGTAAFPEKNSIILGSIKNAKFLAALKKVNPEMLSTLKEIKSKGEGYVMELGPKSTAILAGQDGAGAYYAFRTLLQIVRSDPDKIFQVAIVDWPDHPHRGITKLAILLSHYTDDSINDYLFEQIAGFKINYFSLYALISRIQYKSYARKKSMSPDFVRRMVKFANENFITVVPVVNSHGHSEWLSEVYPQLAEFPERFHIKNHKNKNYSGLVNVRHPDFYKILFPILKEIHELYGKPDVFRIGHDETWCNMNCDTAAMTEATRAEVREMVYEDMVKQNDYLASLGVKDIIFASDMFIPRQNGGAPMNIAQVLKRLPKEHFVPGVWLGYGSSKKGAEKPLKDAGFRVRFAANGPDWFPALPDDPLSVAYYFGNHFLNATTFTYPDKLCRYNGGNGMGHSAFLRTCQESDMFWNVAGGKFQTIQEIVRDKGTEIMRITSDRPFGSSVVYEKIDLKAPKNKLKSWSLPGGKFDFSKVKDTIQESRYNILYPAKNEVLVLDSEKQKYSINVNKKAKVFAFLHCTNLVKPVSKKFIKKISQFVIGHYGKYNPAKVGPDTLDGPVVAKYQLTYSDGSTYQKKIRFGHNIYLWNSSDYTSMPYILKDASEVWEVSYPSGNELSAQVFLLENPHPNKTVKSIQLTLTEKAVEIAVLGIASGN